MFDSHAHVAFDSFDEDREAVIARAGEAGVKGWLEVGTDLEQSQKAVALAQQYEHVFATVGVHPSDIGSAVAWGEIEKLVQHEKVKAIGEVGLDFYRGGDVEQQKEVLGKFIALAQKYNKPVVFHVRNGREVDAHETLISFLGEYPESDRPPGIIHTYSGTLTQAQQYLDLGMYLSFSGVVTFKNAGEIAEAAKTIPLDRILIETDCPFLAPDPYRGKRNEPAYVALVAQKIAVLRNISMQEVEQQTDSSAQKVLGVVW